MVQLRRGWLLTTVSLGILLNPLNSSMISVALARLQSSFHLNFTSVSWIISTYYLSSAIAQPAMGKLADVFGRKVVFMTGLVIVAVSSLLAPFAGSFGLLIAYRILQSIGSSAFYPAGMAIVRNHITDRQANAIAVLAVFSSGSAGLGPTIGGFLIHQWDWPAIFFVNLPFIVVSFLLSWWILPKDAKSAETSKPSIGDLIALLDMVGILLFALATIGILLGLLFIQNPADEVAGTLGLIALGLFVWRELRASTPFIPIRTFAKHPGMTWVDVQFMTVNIIFYSTFFGIPSYLQEVRHFSGQDTGLIMFCLAGCSIFVAPLAGRWVERSGSRPPLMLAAGLMAVGSAWLITYHPHTPIWSVCLGLVVLGFSNGLNNVGMQAALFANTPKIIIGTASGLFQTARYLGTILSSMLLGLVFGPVLSTPGMRLLGAILVIFAILIFGMSWRLPKRRTTDAATA